MSFFKVSQLNGLVRDAITAGLGPDVWVVGEIHGYKLHAKSGHAYFDLVEKTDNSRENYVAKVSCAFFKGAIISWKNSLNTQGLPRLDLANGIEIKLRARVDLYIREGRYQLIVYEIDPGYTFGAIAKKRAQTIEILKKSGLLDKNKALDLPIPALNIGLITSKGSAAYNDFMSIIKGSPYSFRIILADAHMQGDNTPKEVIRAIKTLQTNENVEVIAIIRGGGSKTDLFSFDDIHICTAIADCTKPVITGIGHEIDLSIADMVAHTNLVTPTDVARHLTSKVDELWNYLAWATETLISSAKGILEVKKNRLENMASRMEMLTHKSASAAGSYLMSMAYRFNSACSKIINLHNNRISNMISDIHTYSGKTLGSASSSLDGNLLKIKHLASIQPILIKNIIEQRRFRLKQSAKTIFTDEQARLDRLEQSLAVMNPQDTLKRGYSITLNKDGAVISSSDMVEKDQPIKTMLYKGAVMSIVYDKEPL